ncbi:MAG: hypothetical protein M5R36_25055 [Deltaproteobacteria bacterium]|nr:hypothetical protein [Deltaproteobacteria bacterium]
MSRNALDTFVSEDGWHPNAEGYAIVARLVADSLLPDLDVASPKPGNSGAEPNS